MATAFGNTPGTDRGEDILVSGLTVSGTYLTVGIAADLDGNTLSAIVTPDSAFNTARSISGVTGAKFPMIGLNTNGEEAEVNFGASAFEHAMPAGYSAWDSTCTWNPSDKDASITLSTGNLRATGTVAGWRCARGTVSHTSGKWYFEIKVRLQGGSPGAGNQMVGVGNASALLNNYFTVNANGAGYQSNNAFSTNNSFTATTRVWDEYVNNWRTVIADKPHNGGRWYIEVLCNAVSGSNTGIVMGMMNAAGRASVLRNYIGSDTAGNSAGFQSSRAWLRVGGSTTNVVSGALTATHVYRFDIDLDARTIACALDAGAFCTPQSIASLFPGPGPAADFYFGISLFDAPSVYDSVTVNFGSTAFTYSAPGTALAWDDTSLTSTELRIGGTFVQTLEARNPEIRASALLAEVIRNTTNTPLEVGQVAAEVIVNRPATLIVADLDVQVLRSTAHSPLLIGGVKATVLRSGPVSLRASQMMAEVIDVHPATLIVGAMFAEVLRQTITGGVVSGKFNRAVTVIT